MERLRRISVQISQLPFTKDKDKDKENKDQLLKSPEQITPSLSPVVSNAAPVFQLLDGRKITTYPPRLVQMIYEYHDSTGGKRYSAADIGCGVGTAALAFAPFFDHVAGVEPTASVLKTAAKGKTRSGEQINYQQAEVHHMPYILHNSVDLIISAGVVQDFAYNWWSEADRVLTYDGTIALFTFSLPVVSVPSTDTELDSFTSSVLEIESLTIDTLAEYCTRSDAIVNSLYTTLPFPEAQFAFGKPKNLWWNINEWSNIPSTAHNYAETPDDPDMSRITALNFDSWWQQRKSTSTFTKMKRSNPQACSDLEEKVTSMARTAGWTGERRLDFTSSLGLLLVKKRKRYENSTQKMCQTNYEAGKINWVGGIGTKRSSRYA